MWMEVTEQEAALIAGMTRNRLHDITMLSQQNYPDAKSLDWEKFLAVVEAEKALLRTVGDKAMNTHYAQSVRHTLGADALTPEAAQYIKQELERLNDARGPSWAKIRDELDAVLEPYGLTLEALEYERGCGIALIGDVHA